MVKNIVTLTLLEDLQKKYREQFVGNKAFFDVYFEGINLLKEIVIASKEVMRKANKERKFADGIYAMISIEQTKNLDFFNAHYNLLKEGFCIPSFMPLRAIYENIQRTYLCLVDETHSKIIYDYSITEGLKNLSPVQEEIIKKYKKNGFYSQSTVRNLIYEGKLLEGFKEAYSRLSNHSHPSLRSTSPCYSYESWAIEDTSKSGQDLLVSIIWILFECFGKEFEDSLFEKVKNYVEKCPSIMDFTPNNKKYHNKIILDTHTKFLELLEDPSLKSKLNDVKLYE